MFQVSYDREWHGFEYIFVIVIGIFGVTHMVIQCMQGLIDAFRVFMALL